MMNKAINKQNEMLERVMTMMAGNSTRVTSTYQKQADDQLRELEIQKMRLEMEIKQHEHQMEMKRQEKKREKTRSKTEKMSMSDMMYMALVTKMFNDDDGFGGSSGHSKKHRSKSRKYDDDSYEDDQGSSYNKKSRFAGGAGGGTLPPINYNDPYHQYGAGGPGYPHPNHHPQHPGFENDSMAGSPTKKKGRGGTKIFKRKGSDDDDDDEDSPSKSGKKGGKKDPAELKKQKEEEEKAKEEAEKMAKKRRARELIRMCGWAMIYLPLKINESQKASIQRKRGYCKEQVEKLKKTVDVLKSFIDEHAGKQVKALLQDSTSFSFSVDKPDAKKVDKALETLKVNLLTMN